jgi:catechol 2,3-dioxygenase-like lactoylglutathione lyase family enzyme
MSLSRSLAVTAIPVTDLELAKPFYRDVLGLELIEDTPYALRFSAGNASQISVYKRPQIERGHTVAHFEVGDIDKEVADLRSRGAVFEEYTVGLLATTDGIAQIGTARAAWLKDPEGNVLGLREGPDPRTALRDSLTA